MSKVKNIIPYILAVVLFIIASLAYFSPVLEGKKIEQSDITQFIGSSKEIKDYRKATGEEPYWTNSSFGGMPAYVVSAYYPYDFIKKLDDLIRFLPHPAGYLFLYLLSFFILLVTLNINWKLAIAGAFAFGFSTYFIIILGVGHNAKAHAIAYMPLVLAGIILVFQKIYLIGFTLTSLAMALEISASHIQMTYYLFFIVFIYGIIELIEAIKQKSFPDFISKVAILVVAVLLALGVNATKLMATQEYAKFSTRSKSELTINPDGSPKEVTNGLSNDYITEYSYGKLETFNLFIPRFMGGTRYEQVADSEVTNFLQNAVNKGLNPSDANYVLQLTSMYWGDQPIVAAPAYIGAVLIFLFVLAIFLVERKYKWWLVSATIFAILLSWGKNFSLLTNFFIDYIPLYNKFRAVSSIQVIAELAIPLFAIIGLQKFLYSKIDATHKQKSITYALYIVGGITLLFVIGGTGLFSFETPLDLQIDEQLPGYLDAIVADRQSLFFNDSVRSLLFILLTATVAWGFLKNKIKADYFIAIIALLILVDLVGVDKRYVTNDYFKPARQVDKPFKATSIDNEILKDKGHYRVANFTKNVMADGTTSYFHKSIGGYHAAKPRRYQELFDFQMESGSMNMINMLNTKYLITLNEEGTPALEKNENALGNAWFVDEVYVVTSANDEIEMLNTLDVSSKAVANSTFFNSQSPQTFERDSTASIQLIEYEPNKLIYDVSTVKNQFAVFSEIFYKNGWNAYINNQVVPHYRVNYILRGMYIPAGEYTIEFKFEPEVIGKGTKLTLISYLLFLIIPVSGWLVMKRKSNQ